MNAPTPLSRLEAQQDATVRTTCPYCGVGCGVLATPTESGTAIAGDPSHPANFGRLCSKGSALGETLGMETRLLHPMLHGERVGWTQALDHVAQEMRRIRDAHGPDAIAFYLSGQLLTEDYYVANKLLKGFVGTANVDTNSRLCMSSSVAGHRRAFGSDTVPGSYEDLDEGDLFVFVGSNAAWCHPVLFQRMQRACERRGARFVIIDPRRTATAEEVALFLPIRPGTDSVLFAGLLVHLADTDALDRGFIDTHTSDFDAVLAAARALAPDVAATAAGTDLAREDVAQFFALWRDTQRVVTLYSQGVNQAAQGTDKVNAIINCHLATGRIGRAGMGPFSLTGQPNAMGGREVGGLANQLAAHMNFTPADVERVGRFWQTPNVAQREGLKAVDMFDAIADGRIKALWVMGTNPAVSLPRADAVRAALAKLDLFVVSENVTVNDTVAAKPHVLLPAAAWGEKDGTVTNSERRISRIRPFRAMPGEVRQDWWILSQVATRLGFGSAFAYDSVAAIFREHAALSAFENAGTRDFDIGPLAGLSGEAFDTMRPVQWPVRDDGLGTERLFAQGGFFTPDRRARFIAPQPIRRMSAPSDFPLLLNTGRVRDQWHTMTRTGLSRRLATHRPEPFVEVHPRDAARFALTHGGLARVSTQHGAAVLRVAVTDSVRVGEIFAPIHWSESVAGAARVGALVHALTDPVSGQPDAKATPAAIAPQIYAAAGFALARQRHRFESGAWAWSVAGEGYATRLETDESFEAMFASLRAAAPADAEMLQYRDDSRAVARGALIADGQVAAVLFLGGTAGETPWGPLLPLWNAASLSPGERRMLLSGRSGVAIADTGPTICACFGVGRTVLEGLIEAGARSPEAIGKACRAGTNCGSCVPELRRLVASQAAPLQAPAAPRAD